MGINKGSIGEPLNLSLEFKGGTSTSLVLAEDMSIEDIDAQIVPGIEAITGDGNVQVQKVEGGNEIIVKTRELDEIERQELDALFVKEATAAGFMNLKGHRSVGGMRASIYNAMPLEGVEKLVAFMEEFEKKNK